MKKVCFYCGCRIFQKGTVEARMNPSCTATKDHYIPKMLKTERVNIENTQNKVDACFNCNTVKAWLPAEVFMLFVKTHDRGKITATEFQKFIYKVSLAGFNFAKIDASNRKNEGSPL